MTEMLSFFSRPEVLEVLKAAAYLLLGGAAAILWRSVRLVREIEKEMLAAEMDRERDDGWQQNEDEGCAPPPPSETQVASAAGAGTKPARCRSGREAENDA